jgi:hypothetical protein
VRVLLASGAIVLAVGIALAVARVVAYLESGQAVSSTSGLVVFRVDGELVQYAPYAAGVEPTLIGFGVAVLVVGVFVAALMNRSVDGSRYATRFVRRYSTGRESSSASRASTAGSNADAQTR